MLSIAAELYCWQVSTGFEAVMVGMKRMTPDLPMDKEVRTSGITEAEVEAAAEALRRAMLDRHDLGFAVLLRTNFPDERLKDMAVAALRAAKASL